MIVTKVIAILLAFGGLAAAITAALYWLKASRVSVIHTAASPSDVPEFYILSNEVAFNKSSSLNARAALWTGVSAILNAVATVLGLF